MKERKRLALPDERNQQSESEQNKSIQRGDDVREPIGLKKCATRSQRRKKERERGRNHSHAKKKLTHRE